MSRVLVAGVGNVFLGDDGFGPEVARRLAAEDLPQHVRVVDYGIRGVHLAYDLLDGWDSLVLVDAVPGDGPPGAVEVRSVGADDVQGWWPGTGVDAHGLDPAAVLATLGRLGGTLPPTLLVGCVAGQVAERIGLSDPVRDAVDVAVDAVRRIVAGPVGSGLAPAGPASAEVG